MDENVTAAPPFPGGIGVSHLRVYDTTAPDGLAGGTPHLHTVCTEAYVVVTGMGEVHTLTAAGFQVTALEPGAFVWFSPGTIHRLVNGTRGYIVRLRNSDLRSLRNLKSGGHGGAKSKPCSLMRMSKQIR